MKGGGAKSIKIAEAPVFKAQGGAEVRRLDVTYNTQGNDVKQIYCAIKPATGYHAVIVTFTDPDACTTIGARTGKPMATVKLVSEKKQAAGDIGGRTTEGIRLLISVPAGRVSPGIDGARLPVTFHAMKKLGYTYWQDGDAWLGYLDEFPDYMTQGSSFEDLREHLLDLYKDLSSGVIPNVRRHDVLEVA